jgi:hypothetical protein
MIPTNKKRALGLFILLMISLANYNRIKGNENIRPIQFLSIFTMGVLTGVLIDYIVKALKERFQKNDK